MLTTFKKDESGNFSIMMGIGATMLLAAVGVGVDVSGMMHQRSVMQDYADAAVLAAARTLDDDVNVMTKAAKDSVATNTVLENQITTGLQVNTDTIRADLSANYSTALMGLFGVRELNIDVFAEAPIATPDPLNLSLVLDITGSMQGGNMNSLKISANRLVNTLEKHDSGNIAISVVPFANYVNVGKKMRSQPWLDVPDDWIEYPPPVCGWERNKVGQTCKKVKYGPSTTPGYTKYNDGVPHHVPPKNNPGGIRNDCKGVYEKKLVSAPGVEPKEYEDVKAWVCHEQDPIPHVWHGAVGSRPSPGHLKADYGSDKFPGLMDYEVGTELLPLTRSFGSVKNKINSLAAKGETYIPSGLVWGWRVLTPSQPFTEVTSNQGLGEKRALVLMTDGKNTRYLGKGSILEKPGKSSYEVIDHSTLAIDGIKANEISAELCEGIKSDDIIVYTVAYRFPTGSTHETKQMLKKCASRTDYFYSAENTTELNRAFDAIAANLISVRISG